MAKVKTPFQCLCGHSQDVVYRKPSLFQPTPVSVTCQKCESIYFVKFKKDPKLAHGMIGIEMRLDHASEYLKNFLHAEQLKAKAKAQADEKAKDSFRFGANNGIVPAR